MTASNWNDLAWTQQAHDCATDHIDGWGPTGSRTFGDAERAVLLSFTPCPYAPDTTLILHLELVGTVYRRMQNDAGISIPPPPRPAPMLLRNAPPLAEAMSRRAVTEPPERLSKRRRDESSYSVPGAFPERS